MRSPMRILTITLVVSFGLNLFLLGFGVSHWLAHRGRQRGGGAFEAGGRPLLFHAAEALGGKKHPQIRRVFREHRGEFRAGRRQLLEARQAVHEALVREPFEPARLEQALADLRRQTKSVQRPLHAALVELARGLTPEERQKLAEFNRVGRHDGRRWHRRDGPHRAFRRPRTERANDDAGSAPAGK